MSSKRKYEAVEGKSEEKDSPKRQKLNPSTKDAPKISQNRVGDYRDAVNILQRHVRENKNPKLETVANESKETLSQIENVTLSIAVVGPAGQGKSTFGNRMLWQGDPSKNDQLDFPLSTSSEDHKTNRCIYCRTSPDKKTWRISFELKKEIPGNPNSQAYEIVAPPKTWDENSIKLALEDPRSIAEEFDWAWEKVISIHLEGPFHLQEGIVLIDTPGWNFNFGDSDEEATLQESLNKALLDAKVLIHLNIAPRIHGKEDIQTLLEKLPSKRTVPPIIVPAWTCASEPQRTHAEKIRHALQTLKSDTTLGDQATQEDLPTEFADPWERYQLFDQMMKNTMLFTVPYSFNHWETFFSQLKDVYTYPLLVKLHWALKTFTLLGKRKKSSGDSDAKELAKDLEESQRKLHEGEWEAEHEIYRDLKNFSEAVFEATMTSLSNPPARNVLFKGPWQALQSFLSVIKRAASLKYQKLIYETVRAQNIMYIDFVKSEAESDTDSDTDDIDNSQMLDNESYQFVSENFQQKINEQFNSRQELQGSFQKMMEAVHRMTRELDLKSLLVKVQEAKTSDSPAAYEVDDESPSYIEKNKTFCNLFRTEMKGILKSTIGQLKEKAKSALTHCITLLRVDAVESIANCVADIKLSNIATKNISKSKLTSKDPLVHINKITDVISQLEKRRSQMTKEKAKPRRYLRATRKDKTEDDQIIHVSSYEVAKKIELFSFQYQLHPNAFKKIQDFSDFLNTQKALEKTLYPLFILSGTVEEGWMRCRNFFKIHDELDLDVIHEQFLMFIVSPKKHVKTLQKLVNDQSNLSEAAKGRIFFVALNEVDETSSASVWLEVAKGLAEAWKFSLLSLNVFYRMFELDLANFRLRKASLARGLLIMQSMMHNYRFYAAQEFSKLLHEDKYYGAVIMLLGQSGSVANISRLSLIRDRKSFVSFAAMAEFIEILEGETEKQKDKNLSCLSDVKQLVTKLTDLLSKISMISSVNKTTGYQKLASCFPFLFDVLTAAGEQTKFLSLNNSFAQRGVLFRNLVKKIAVQERELPTFLKDYKAKEKEFASRCRNFQAIAIATPYIQYRDLTKGTKPK